MEKKLNWNYRAIQFLMSCMMGVVLAYASVYLLHKGFNSTTIGTIISVSSILSIALQTGLANLTDKHKSLKIQDILNSTNLLVIGASLLLLILPNKLTIAALSMIILTMVKTHIPFVNSLAFIFEEDGIHVNFGIGRAFGSLAYAVSTVVVGQAVEFTSPNVLPVFYIVFTLMYIVSVKTYELKPEDELHNRIYIHDDDDDQDSKEETEVPTSEIKTASRTYPEFFRSYPTLFYLSIGMVFLLFAHSFINTFFIQIITPIGGNNANLGTAIFIAGAVEFLVIMNFERLANKFSVTTLMKIATLFFLAKNTILFLAPNMTVVYISQFLSLGANALSSPALVQYINDVVDARDLVKGQSLATIGMTLAGVFASFFGGILIDTLGVKMAMFVGIVTTVIGLVAVFAFARENVGEKKRSPKTAQVPTN